MVTSIPNENELSSLQRKIKKWYSQEEPSKQTNGRINKSRVNMKKIN